MKNKHKSIDDYGKDDFEWYEERKGKIKKVDSDHRPRRETRNWKKVWSERADDYDEYEDFFNRQ
jgi:hypothetical protein